MTCMHIQLILQLCLQMHALYGARGVECIQADCMQEHACAEKVRHGVSHVVSNIACQDSCSDHRLATNISLQQLHTPLTYCIIWGYIS